MDSMLDTLNIAKLRKVYALIDSPHEGESINAMELTRAMLAKAGKTFRDIPDLLGSKPQERPTPTQPTTNGSSSTSHRNPFEGFDDWMEKKEPGWKAKQARAKAERDRKKAEYRAEVIRKYGSKKAALADDDRQRAVDAAAAHLRRKEPRKFANGTFECETIDGWHSFTDGPVSDRAAAAIRDAFPFPETVTEAKREYDYWNERDRELEVVHNHESAPDTYLSLACEIRRDLVQDAFVKDLRARSLEEVEIRAKFGVDHDWYKGAEEAVLEDLRYLIAQQNVQAGQQPANNRPVQNGHHQTATDRRAEVVRLLSNVDTAGLPDREIARMVGVSPQTVGNIRRRMKAAGH